MRPSHLSLVLLFGLHGATIAFDAEKASDQRFKVSFVEPKELPPLSDLPAYFPNREMVIADDALSVKRGDPAEDIRMMRVLHFRYGLYPIRVVDQETGNTYEVQSDRRTIIAKKRNGELIWKVNPFVDAKLGPYRVQHPFITYFGKSANRSNLKGPVLSIAFSSSQFGDIELATGKFHFGGQD